MKILWQSFVDCERNAAYRARLEHDLNEMASSGTKVDVVGITPPDRDLGRLSELRCAVIAVNNAIEAESRGYDGYVMGHFQDPGLYEARSAVRIPVVGTGEATLHFAAQLGRRIGLVTLDPVFEVFHLEQAERYGLATRVTHVAGLGLAPESFGSAFAGDQAAYARLRDDFIACAEPLVRGGCDIIVPAGVLPGLLLGREHGLKVLHAPVVNCAATALMTAEMSIRLRAVNGLEASRGPSFALAPARAVADFQLLVAGGTARQPTESLPGGLAADAKPAKEKDA